MNDNLLGTTYVTDTPAMGDGGVVVATPPFHSDALLTGEFAVSLSAVQTYWDCEQLYDYTYVKKLSPKAREVPLERGSIFHDDYLEVYYKGLKDAGAGGRGDGRAVHDRALERVNTAARAKCLEMARTCAMLGIEDGAEAFKAMPDAVLRIAERYWQVRGRGDAERYEVVRVEEYVRVRLGGGIVSNGRIDLIAKDKGNGRLSLWEHKSTENVPPDGIRLRDLQTLLYRYKVRQLWGLKIDSIIWNYIRTKEPSVPEVLKSGGISRAKGIDTTWPIYEKAVQDCGDDPNKAIYDGVRERLEGREEKVFFPRYEKVTVLDEDLVMANYAATAREMRDKVKAWGEGRKQPIRTLSRRCEYCSFSAVCLAALVGGDEEDVLRLKFRSSRHR